MFKFGSQEGRVLPRALILQTSHPNIRQSREECQQPSPLTPHVKALQWSSDPPILLTATSRQPCSNGNFMDGVPLYRAWESDWATLGARCALWRKYTNYPDPEWPLVASPSSSQGCVS